MKINRGQRLGNDYIKFVHFDDAVLWKTKELSLPPEIVEKIKAEGLSNILFADIKRNQKLSISVENFLKNAQLIQRHQESQYYIHLSNFKTEKYDENKESRDIKLI